MKLAILGAGESGIGAAMLGQKHGYDVFLSDNGLIKKKYKDALSHLGIEYEENGHSVARILTADLVVKSPGIPDTVPLIKNLVEEGIEVISEIEFGFRYTKGKVVAITGTNGKTTTALLTHHMLQRAGLDVALGGNIGTSFAKLVAENDRPYYVLEVSSFQLDGCTTFKPFIGMVINITKDHLDRYNESLEEYAQAKFRMVQCMDEHDHFIYWADDPVIADQCSKHTIKAAQHPFSLKSPQVNGAYLTDETITINTNNKPIQMSIHELALQGKHNVNNTMAGGIAARILEIRKEVIRDSMSDFQNVEHRLELVTTVSGVEYINDSKATNVNSTWYALESMTNPTIWIVGGVDKGNDYTLLTELVKNKVSKVICLGQDVAKIHKAFGSVVGEMYDAASMHEAVSMAYRLADKGDAVLLSPACASFDLFENYEDRGRQFKESVRSL